MVFQNESAASWMWQLKRSNSGKEDAFGSCSSTSSTTLGESDDEAEKRDRERAFDIADSVEKGLAREVVAEFTYPLRKSSKLWRFHVVRSEDKLQYRLFSDDGAFLMYAKANLDACRVDFFLYNPTDKHERLYDPRRPAFTMSYSKDKTEWKIVQERCDHCQFLPKHMSCACHGKQQVAYIRHSRKPIGEGIFNCMEVQIPGAYSDGSRVIWCPTLGMGDLARPQDDHDAQTLCTKKPSWNDEVESLVLDFKGRNIQSSAKNFQLACPERPEHVICQYGKIGPMTFSLDFKYPLSVIQAFGISLTTLFWT